MPISMHSPLVRCKSGADFVCKVLVVGNDGKTGLFALRQALSGGGIFQAENHILVFPMGSPVSMSDLIHPMLADYCSLEDLLEAVAQALEVSRLIREPKQHHLTFQGPSVFA